MKWLLLFGVGCWCLAVSLEAAGPNEEYVRIYTLMQQGEKLETAAQGTQALAAYLDARQGLLRLKRSQPEWNPKVVDFRLRYLETKIEQLTPKAPVVTAPKPTEAPAPAPDPAGTATAIATRDQLAALQTELQRVQSENSVLQAKLREALTALPAAVDPHELEKSEARERQLTAEVTSLREQLARVQAELEVKPEVQKLKETQADLERARESLAAQAKMTEGLETENQMLKQLVTQLRASSSGGADTQQRLEQALAELALLRSEADILQLEKAALEQRLRANRTRAGEWAEARAAAGTLERERDALKTQLAQANDALAAESLVTVGEPTGINPAMVNQLQARLAVYEAESIPYSVEEQALFRLSQSTDQPPQPSTRPASPSPLLMEAELHFQRGELAEAEAAFHNSLTNGGTNAFALANLAAVQVEQGKQTEAEANLRAALKLAPNDAFALATMGYLKFQQENYDQALDYLSLAAQQNPNNAKIQNYLGVTLSQKGLRGPAENALRKAIQLQPGFAQPHFNLALVYVLQEPPLYQLARWHYQKALAAGHERSTNLEQLLEAAAAKPTAP